MNVACTACPAKYAVPDERVRGKRARITCKHCGTSIIVDGTALGPSDGGSVVAQRPARKTMLGMGQAGASGSAAAAASSAPLNSSPLNSAPSNAPPTGGSAWLVALADGRREPASQARIVDLFSAGTIDASTYIWREGMPEWKTPFAVPEVAAALTARGLKPRQASLPPTVSEPDPEEATRVAISAADASLIARSQATARAVSVARRSQPPPPEDDDGITIARSGPPSSPGGYLPPLRRASEPPAASPRAQPAGASARPLPARPAGASARPLPALTAQPAGASARPPAPSAARSAPPSAEPPPRGSSDAPPNPRGRPRAYTLPGDLVIPLTGPAAPPPTPLFAPRGQPFAARRATPSSLPGPSALVVPSAPVASSAPPAPSAPPVAQAPSAPPAAVLPEAALAGAPSAMHSAPARNPAEFEAPPRSAAPVALPLEFAQFTQGQKRRRFPLALVASFGVLAVGGLGFAAYWTSRTPPPKATVAAPTPSAVVPAPVPSAEPAVAPVESTEAEAAAPSASADSEKPAARERAAAPAAARAAASRRDEARAASARKAEPKPEAQAESEATPSSDSEGEAPARAEEAPKKAETGAPGSPPFDRETASQSLTDAALRAGTCRMLGGPTGSAQATVTFSPSGQVSAASVGGDFAGTVVGSCIAKLFRGVSVPPFSGESVTVAKRFNVE